MKRWAGSALVVAACGQPSPYTCTASNECVRGGVHGTCTQSFCAFPDTTCSSGLRFEPNAGDGLGGQCSTGQPIDAAIDARVDAPRGDGPLPDGPGPAIAFVQTNGGKNSGGTTDAITFAQAVTTHDTLIVCMDVATSGYATVSDSLGNTFTPVVGPISSVSVRFYIFAAFDVAGGSDTVTITVSSAANTVFEGYIHEYAGLAGFDVGAGADGSTTGTDGMKSGPVQTRYANELIFGFGVTGTAAAGTNFTLRSTFDSNATEDRIVTSPGVYEATETMTAGTGWDMLVAAFRGF